MRAVAVAARLLVDLGVAGVSTSLRGKKLVLAPGSRVTDALRGRVLASLHPLVELLENAERRSTSSPASSIATASLATARDSPCCGLRRFPEWDPSQVFRFCCEPSHAHADSIPTYDSDETDVLIEWAHRAGVRQLSGAMKGTLLSIKTEFGGRVVHEASA